MGTRERRERSDKNDLTLSGFFHSALEALDGEIERNSRRFALAAVGGTEEVSWHLVQTWMYLSSMMVDCRRWS